MELIFETDGEVDWREPRTLEAVVPRDPPPGQQGSRLVIETFEGFEVRDLRVDDETQLMGGTALPAELFQPGIVDAVRLALKPMAAGSRVVLKVARVSDAGPARFRAKLVVRSVEHV